MMQVSVYDHDGGRVWQGRIGKLVLMAGEYESEITDRITKPQLVIGRQFPGFVIMEPEVVT